MPELIGPLYAEEARTAPPAERLVALQQSLHPHHALGAFAVDLPAEPLACERRDHPRPIRRVVASDVDDQPIDRINNRATDDRRAPLRLPIQPRPVDLEHARDDRGPSAPRDKLAGPGGARPHSQPRNASPAISSS